MIEELSQRQQELADKEKQGQLTAEQRWLRILAHAVRSWLGGRQLRPPPRLMAPA